MESVAAKPFEMPKAYDPQQAEARRYRFWQDRGYFTPQIDPERDPFVIIMPPPNVTGELHLGHALVSTLEDIMTRHHRMKGEPTLWLPGVDHAAIAVQNVVEQELAKEGLSRHDLGRERFLERVWQFINKYRGVITQQHQRLGVSCDWSRERFTMDEGPSRAVRTTFVNLYHEGLIYRGERIINWCPRCQTALSDLEVDHEEHAASLYYVRYPLLPEKPGGQADFITVATTRPETILGDTAVAVNPDDVRFRALVGRFAVLPILDRVIPMVADAAVDPAFGTGAVKVTPAHDPVDFEIGQRLGLAAINIMNPDATMNEEAGPYAGLDRNECRQAILADLERAGLMVKAEPYTHSVGHCQRCRTVVEPRLSEQWFVAIQPLAQPAIEAVTSGRIRFIPERFTKEYLNWMEKIRDWCISRQLWWGHRIPVWYCQECGAITVPPKEDPTANPTACSACGSTQIEQDPDVLDTWFSSGLWPHSTLGWPEDTEDLRYFYPTTVMETAYDILFFWVARMIMMGIKNTGDIPFRIVYLHGLVRDENGEKMSKSKGNVLNPLELIDRYGCDALRYALITGNTPGNDMKLAQQKVEGGRNFANKLWNATRYVLSALAESGAILSLSKDASSLQLDPALLHLEDRWILSRLHRVVAEISQLMDEYQLGEACRRAHDFLWGEFCDWYIEMSKIRLREGGALSGVSSLSRDPSKGSASATPAVLAHVLQTGLRLLHPFMPFVTEELWQRMRDVLGAQAQGGLAEALIVAPWPQADPSLLDEETERQVEAAIGVIRAIRDVRADYRVEPGRFIEAAINTGALAPAFEAQRAFIRHLARVDPLTIMERRPEPGEGQPPAQVVSRVLASAQVYLPLAGLVDIEAERRRLSQEMEAARADIARLEAKLADANFVGRAPEAVVARERERLSAAQERLAALG